MKYGEVCVPEGKSGAYAIEEYEVSACDSEFTKIRAIRDPREYVPAGTYTKLRRNGTIVMSNTPAEIQDSLHVYARACRYNLFNPTFTMLINGLGLGMLPYAILEECPKLAKLTIIEIAPEVIELVGPTLVEKYGDRLEIIQADAYEYKPPKGAYYNLVWHDIWDTSSLDNLPQMTKLHRKYGKRCEWQDSWTKKKLERIKKSETKNKFHALPFLWS